METENSLLLFSVSITHNSKIRELSDGNKVMETELSFGQTTFLLWVLPFLSYELWKLRIELWKHLVQTGSRSLNGDPGLIDGRGLCQVANFIGHVEMRTCVCISTCSIELATRPKPNP